jgi:hypothetical protein
MPRVGIKRARSSPSRPSRPSQSTEKPDLRMELLKECASDIEVRIPTLEHKINVLRNNKHVMKDMDKMADAMEWEKDMLIGRLERIKGLL